jgi:hypothetical protein
MPVMAFARDDAMPAVCAHAKNRDSNPGMALRETPKSTETRRPYASSGTYVKPLSGKEFLRDFG